MTLTIGVGGVVKQISSPRVHEPPREYSATSKGEESPSSVLQRNCQREALGQVTACALKRAIVYLRLATSRDELRPLRLRTLKISISSTSPISSHKDLLICSRRTDEFARGG
ncbi:hypothetical protein BDN71DRAFT_1451537 [Pleurotus eryngii]|uniref:Uncharacterized protein n=1 Tax=Pleurotus eryngii TaxID=5323 RepID=A0A9P6D4M8_PLEER|nr:hypothetical protein BDN71DRAFT_1451537 [Pleurotus eryngii]